MHDLQEKYGSVSCNGATGNLPPPITVYCTRLATILELLIGRLMGIFQDSTLDPCTARQVYHIMNIQYGHHASPLVHAPFCQASNSSSWTSHPPQF